MQNDSVSEQVSVLIEWTEFDPDECHTLEDRLQLLNRVDALARMLNSSHKRHPDLHTLDCIGYAEDAANSRYGMIYATPSFTNGASLSSLSTALDSPAAHTLADLLTRETPDLDVRFALAHTLAVALWSCHALDWLHKTLCPHNVLFFAAAAAAAPAHPYLAGFDASRPEHLAEMTAAPPRASSAEALYRHPASLGAFREPYRKGFDIYSLGLILLEIGLWRRIDAFHKPKYSASDFRERVVKVMVPALGSKCGARYRRAVEACLVFDKGGKEGEAAAAAAGGKEEITPHMVMESVVGTLEQLRV